VALAYTEDSRWRNRVEFIEGRAAIIAFLERKWARVLDYRLIKEVWKEVWGFARTGWRCGSPMNGETIPAIGSAATATKTGSSTPRA
jgi:hypothetical protein